jgi:hypothetical protein
MILIELHKDFIAILLSGQLETILFLKKSKVSENSPKGIPQMKKLQTQNLLKLAKNSNIGHCLNHNPLPSSCLPIQM